MDELIDRLIVIEAECGMCNHSLVSVRLLCRLVAAFCRFANLLFSLGAKMVQVWYVLIRVLLE